MREPLIWNDATTLVPLSQANSEDLADIVTGTYGFEDGESGFEDEDFIRRYAAKLLESRS